MYLLVKNDGSCKEVDCKEGETVFLFSGKELLRLLRAGYTIGAIGNYPDNYKGKYLVTISKNPNDTNV